MEWVPERLKASGRPQEQKPFNPAVGADFGDVGQVEARARGFFLRAVVSAVGIGLAVTGMYWLVTGKCVAVTVVWAIGGPIIGAMATYYFGPRWNESG